MLFMVSKGKLEGQKIFMESTFLVIYIEKSLKQKIWAFILADK